ncbi:hypothetical protein OAP50_00610, partial [bacterium]|nr:hypothetical protein [bacterium]
FTFLFFVILSGIIRLTVLWTTHKISFLAGVDFSKNIFNRTLHQTYETHINRNSSELISGINIKVTGAINLLYEFLTLISSSSLLIALIITLCMINFTLTILSALIFILSYVIISFFTHKKLKFNSLIISTGQNKTVKILQEGLGTIKDILINNKQNYFTNFYSKEDFQLRGAIANTKFISAFPKAVMEVFGIVVISLIAAFFSIKDSNNFKELIPVFGALALGSQKILPLIQQLYKAWANLIGNKESTSNVVDLLNQPIPEAYNISRFEKNRF